MAHYFISGIWGNPIQQVLLHETSNNGQNFQNGFIRTRQYIVDLLRAGHTAQTLRWSYATGSWQIGANVEVIIIDRVAYLRTDGNNTKSDNLDNSLPIHDLGL